MYGALWAVVWAHGRARRNALLSAHRIDSNLQLILRLLWYGLWTVVAVMAGAAVASGRAGSGLLSSALFQLGMFWQFFPLVTASGGSFLDLGRLRAYPIPDAALFWLEVGLRLSSGAEAAMVLAGVTIGAMAGGHGWAWLPFGIYGAFHLLLATGLKTLIERLMKRRGLAELVVLGLVLLAQAPHMVMTGALPAPAREVLHALEAGLEWLPPAAAVHSAYGEGGWRPPLLLVAWLAAAWLFARRQFARTMAANLAGPAVQKASAARSRGEWLFRWPERYWRDPLAVIVEKDLRVLSRAPRFRLLFAMACVMGQLLWMPLGGRQGWVAENHLALSLLYAQLVLGDLLIWNVFGLEGAAAQIWFVLPVDRRRVLRAKNLVAVIAMGACWLVVTAIVLALPVAMTVAKWAEAVTAAAVMLVLLLGLGNLASVASPRALDPSQSWRNASRGRAQLFLILLYPLVALPVGLAYLARWATGAEWAFFATMAVSLGLAAIFYHVATAEAEERMERRREEIVAALTLSTRQGPIGGA